MYLDELSKYKSKVMQMLCENPKIQVLILSKESLNPKKELMYKYVFPYAFVPDTVTNSSTFICFDIEVKRVENRSFKDLSIMFWIFSHQSILRTNEGVRTDVLADEVDKIMNGNKNLGLGTVELKTVGRVNPAKDYFGRTLVYRSVDFNRVL